MSVANRRLFTEHISNYQVSPVAVQTRYGRSTSTGVVPVPELDVDHMVLVVHRPT